MNIREIVNIAPTKFFNLLDMSSFDLEKNPNKISTKYIDWFTDLKKYGVDTTRYLLIIQSMDDHQWKNLYIFLYSRWLKCIVKIEELHKIKLRELEVFTSVVDYSDTIKNFIDDDISNAFFFINTLQIFFIPNPN